MLRSLPLALALLGATPASAQLLHRYSFDGTGTTVLDAVGGADGTILGGAALSGAGDLTLDGADDFVELPAGMVSGLTDATIEVWATWDGPQTSNWQRLFDFGDSTGGPGNQGDGVTFLALTPRENTLGVTAAAFRSTAAGSVKSYAANGAPVGALVHYAVVVEAAGPTMSLFVDGVFEAAEVVDGPLSGLVDVNCWLGRSQWSANPNFAGTFTELRIHGAALDAGALAASALAGPDAVDVGSTYCAPAVPNSTGQSAEILGLGNADGAAGPYSLVLAAHALPPNEFGYFIAGRTQGFTPMPGGSQGNLCLAIPLARVISSLQSSGASGTFLHDLDVNAIPLTPVAPIVAGETWSFQAWYRDVNPASTSNFTSGLAITYL